MSTIKELQREASVPSVIADHFGCITHVNKAFEAVFGWRAEEAIGKPLTIIIPRVLHDAHHLGFSRFLTTGQGTLLGRPLMLKAVTKDGRELDTEHLIVAERRGGQWVFGATIRPLAGT